MRKAIEESKRSIHSTRIDVIAGDPVPISPKNVLPINPITRPTVEDPEYLPDTTSELAASLSALARIVPPQKVQEIYRTIRDIIDRIAPVTRTSLDELEHQLNEGVWEDLTQDQKSATLEQLNSQVKHIIASIEAKITHYESVGTEEAERKIADLTSLGRKIVDVLDVVKKTKDADLASARTPEQARKVLNAMKIPEKKHAAALAVFQDMTQTSLVKLYDAFNEVNKYIRDQETSFDAESKAPTGTTAYALRTGIFLTEANILEIAEAFDDRIRQLRASGDQFDANIAKAVEMRREAVSATIKRQQQRESLVVHGSLLAKKVTGGVKKQAKRDVLDSAIEVGKIVGMGLLDRDEGRLLILEKIFPQKTAQAFSLTHANKTTPSGEISEADEALARRALDLMGSGEKIGAEEEKPKGYLSESLFREITQNYGDLSQFKLEVARTKKKVKGVPVTYYFLSLSPYFAAGRVRVVPADGPVEYDKDNPDMRFIAPVGYVFVYERFLQMFDGTEIKIRPDVSIDFDGIEADFVDNAAEDLSRQGVKDAVSIASDFYERNKMHIIKDALDVERGVGKSADTGRKVTKTAERSALVLANSKLAELKNIAASQATSEKQKVLDVLRQEARDLYDKNLGESEAVEKLASYKREVRKDEIKRLVSSVWSQKDKETVDDKIRTQQLRRDVRSKIRRSISMPGLDEAGAVKSGEPARLMLEFEERVKESFSSVSKGDLAALKARRINLNAVETASEENDAAVDSAIQGILTNRAIPAADQVDKSQQFFGLIDSLAQDLVQIAQDRSNKIEQEFYRLQRERPSVVGLPTFPDLTRQVNRALEELRQTQRRAKSGLLAVGVAKSFASVSRLFTDSASSDILFDQVIASIASSNVGDVISQSIDQIRTQGLTVRYAKVNLDQSQSDLTTILPYVARIVADLETDPAVKSAPDFMSSLRAAITRYGLNFESLPVFADAELKNQIAKIADEESVAVLKYPFAKVLLGVPGTSAALGLDKKATAGMPAEKKLLVLQSTTDALASAALQNVSHTLSNSANPAAMLRTLVAIACQSRIILQNSQSRYTSLTDLINALVDIVAEGKRAPAVRLRSLIQARGSVQRPVSVDLQETGVGVYVDLAGNSVVRVVASESLASDKAGSLAFIDPVLESDFQSVVQKVADNITGELGVDKTSEQHDIIKSEVVNQAVKTLEEAAAATNLVIVPVNDQNVSRPNVVEFRKLQSTIINDPESTSFMRAVAIAAYNYTVINEKLPDDTVPYFTPVRQGSAVSPETGEPLLKSGFDFVKQTFPLSATYPTIRPLPSQLTDSFVNEVCYVVRQHILTTVNDVLGTGRGEKEIRLLTVPSRKKGKGSKITDLTQKEKFDQHALSTAAFASDHTIARSQLQLRDSQILTVNPVVSLDLTPEDRERLRSGAKKFVIKMMMNSKGYKREKSSLHSLTKSGEESDTKKSVRLEDVLLRPDEYLNSQAVDLLQRVDDFVLREIMQSGVDITSKVTVDADGKKTVVVYNTATMESEAVARARAAKLKRVGEEFFPTLGLKAPVNIDYDPSTGQPVLPPSPSEFMRKELGGRFNSVGEKLADPIKFYTSAMLAAQKYEKLLERYKVKTADTKPDDATEILLKLSTSFPNVVDLANEIARKKVRQPPTIQTVPHLELVADPSSYSIVGCSNPVADDDLARLTQQVVSSRDDLIQKTQATQQFRGITSQLSSINNDIASLRKVAKTYSKKMQLSPSEEILKGSEREKIRRQRALDAYDQLKEFVDLYERCAGELNAAMSSIVNSITEEQFKKVNSAFVEDYLQACLQEIRQLEENQKGDKKIEELSGIAQRLQDVVDEALGNKKDVTYQYDRSFRTYVTDLRKAKGITPQAAAERIGISLKHLERIEGTDIKPGDDDLGGKIDQQLLRRMSSVYGVSMNSLERQAGVRTETQAGARAVATKFKLPTYASIAGDLAKEFRAKHEEILKSLENVRVRANERVTSAERAIDDDLRLMASRAVKYLRETGRSMMRVKRELVTEWDAEDHFKIFDTLDELDAFKDGLIIARRQHIIMTLPEQPSEKAMEQIQVAAEQYAFSVMTHMIFGVRHVASGEGARG